MESRFINDMKQRPKSDFVIVFLVFACIVYLFFINPQDQSYHEEVGEEIKLAKAVCEASLEWVLDNRERLKLGQDDLSSFKPDGKHTAKFERIRYPEILFYDTGYRGATDGADLGHRRLYCAYVDPRDGTEFYFDYYSRIWVDKIGLRR